MNRATALQCLTNSIFSLPFLDCTSFNIKETQLITNFSTLVYAKLFQERPLLQKQLDNLHLYISKIFGSLPNIIKVKLTQSSGL